MNVHADLQPRVNDLSAPGLDQDDQVVLFDAVCKLCSAWATFLIHHDRSRRYKLASVQSEAGKRLLDWCGLPTAEYNTLVLIKEGKFFVRSDAVIQIVSGLPFPWSLARVGRIIPRPIRDWAYDKIARNRYRWFGKYDVCLVPNADHLGRYLDE